MTQEGEEHKTLISVKHCNAAIHPFYLKPVFLLNRQGTLNITPNSLFRWSQNELHIQYAYGSMKLLSRKMLYQNLHLKVNVTTQLFQASATGCTFLNIVVWFLRTTKVIYDRGKYIVKAYDLGCLLFWSKHNFKTLNKCWNGKLQNYMTNIRMEQNIKKS